MLRRTSTSPLGLLEHRIRRAEAHAEEHADGARMRADLATLERDARADAKSLRELFGSAAYRKHPVIRRLDALETALGLEGAPTRIGFFEGDLDDDQTHGLGTNLFREFGITPFAQVRDLIVRTAGRYEQPWVKYALFEDADTRLQCWIGHEKNRKHFELPPENSAFVAAGYLYVDLHADRLAFDGSSSFFPTVLDCIIGGAGRSAERCGRRRALNFFQARLGPAVSVLPFAAASCLASPPEYHHPDNFAQQEWWRLERMVEQRTMAYVVFADADGLLDFVVGASVQIDQLPAHARIVGGGCLQLAPNGAPTLRIDGAQDALLAIAPPDRLASPYGLPAVVAYYRRLFGTHAVVEVFADVHAIGAAAEERLSF